MTCGWYGMGWDGVIRDGIQWHGTGCVTLRQFFRRLPLDRQSTLRAANGFADVVYIIFGYTLQYLYDTRPLERQSTGTQDSRR